MKSIIFRTVAPFLAGLMMLFSIFVLLRGHNEPGGGFIGGLIAVSALAIYGIAHGVETVRRRYSSIPWLSPAPAFSPRPWPDWCHFSRGCRS